jgi:hypothetical protein
MGVALTLEGASKSRTRKRGHHARTVEEQACVDAFAAFLRCDAPRAGRCLSRLETSVLAARLLPAARALADAVGIVLAEDVGGGSEVALDFTVSPACLLGQCRDGRPGACQSALCEHDCHVGHPGR